MRILTGNTGTDHIKAADDGALHAAIVGSGEYVFDIGSKFAVTVLDSSAVSISDGEGMLQGRHFRTEPGQADTVNLTENAEGYNRNDLIGVLYTNTADVESMAWSVVQGTAVTGTAEDPTPNTGNLLGGASSVFMPMFRVRMRGSSLAGVDAIYKLIKPLSQHTHTAAELGGLPLIQTGSISDDYSASASTTKDFAVSFPVPFKAGTTPVVVASFDSTSTEAAFGKCCLSTLNITGSGFTLRLFNGDTSKRHPGFRWIAVGER